MDIEQTLLSYLCTVDSSLDKLSKRDEGKIPGLPSWVLGNREIVIGVTEDSEGIVLKVTPREEFDQDIVSITTIKNQ